MRIITKRCEVRAFREEDIDEFMQYRNDEMWMKFQNLKRKSKKEYRKILIKELVIENGIQLAIIKREDNSLIGDIYLKKEENVFWIGYTIKPSDSRKGYAYEIIKAIISWAKQEGDFKIKAGVDFENVASINLLEKIGFKYIEEESVNDAIYEY